MDARPRATDALLLQARAARAPDWPHGSLPAPVQAALPGWQAQLVWATPQTGSAEQATAPVLGPVYLYLQAPQRLQADGAWRDRVAALCQPGLAGWDDLRVSRLERVFDAPGAAWGQTPHWHYVVETDPEAGWMPELSRWYDEEHMPGLAQVPGTVLAQRYLNHDHGPLSLARYDLVAREVLDSPPWLAVRGTPWSDRVRPHFTNTRRTLFDYVATPGDPA